MKGLNLMLKVGVASIGIPATEISVSYYSNCLRSETLTLHYFDYMRQFVVNIWGYVSEH